jgi:hypothetical protein
MDSVKWSVNSRRICENLTIEESGFDFLGVKREDLLQSVQTISGAQPLPHQMDKGGSFMKG